jgi:hypothetical protein
VSGLQTVNDGESRYAVSKPMTLDDLLPNSFVLLAPHAMSEHNTDGGKMALSIFMAAMGGVSAAYGNSANSAALSESAGRLAGESTVVASHWKGGSFTARTFPDGTGQEHRGEAEAGGRVPGHRRAATARLGLRRVASADRDDGARRFRR